MKILNISHRKQKLVGLINSVTYSNDELKLLKDILESHITGDLISPPKEEDTYIALSSALQWIIEDGGIWAYEREDTSRSSKMNLMQYLLVDFPKIFIFLTMVPLNRMPLYLWKPGIAPIAEWRTRINR